MKNYNLNSTRYKTNILKTINYPFCENDILYLQEAFLTNGIHYFNIKQINLGRKIIDSILNSLKYYQSIACLTVSKIRLSDNIADLYTILNEKNCLNEPQKNLTSFFLEEFYYDFLWIEENEQFKKQEWYNLFNQCLIELNLDKSMPIILITSD